MRWPCHVKIDDQPGLNGKLVYAGLARVQSLIPDPLYWAWQRTLILTVLAFACAMPGVL